MYSRHENSYNRSLFFFARIHHPSRLTCLDEEVDSPNHDKTSISIRDPSPLLRDYKLPLSDLPSKKKYKTHLLDRLKSIDVVITIFFYHARQIGGKIGHYLKSVDRLYRR